MISVNSSFKGDQNIWAEKYRPNKVSECILPDRIKKLGQEYVDGAQLSHMLLTGSAGTGKTTFAQALLTELGYEYIKINGSLEGRLIDTIRNKITQFVTTKSFEKKKKAIIFDEADQAPADTVQTALRGFIDEFGKNCIFIFTCNYDNQIIEPIKSRCPPINFTYSNSDKRLMLKDLCNRLFDILKSEGVQYDTKTVGAIAIKLFPDFRKTINTLQRLSNLHQKKITVESYGEVDSIESDIKNLIGLLIKRDFSAMRGWVAECQNQDIGFICREVYNQLNDYKQELGAAIPEIVILMAKYQYQHAFAADKEINLVAMFTEIMGAINA